MPGDVHYQASGKESNSVIAIFAGLIILIFVVYYLIQKSVSDTAAAVTKPLSDAGAAVKDSVDNAVNAVFNPNKTDLQTLNEITARNYDVVYSKLDPVVKADIQTSLGATKSYYELHQSAMPFDVFTHEVIKQADPVKDGGCPVGYHLSDNGMGCIRDDSIQFTNKPHGS